MEEKKIVIIGAGYAGVHAAKRLARKYKKDDSVSITLIDRDSYHTMMTSLHEVAGRRVEPDAVMFDLRKLFNRTKVKLVTDNVEHVNHEDKVIQTTHHKFDYDYLILGMGAEPNDFGTPGVKEHAFTLWSLQDAIKLRDHIEKSVSQGAVERDEAKRRALLTFTVCGSGFTGVEMVGELLEWKKRLAKDHKIDPSEITLNLVEAAPTILNMLDRKSAGKAERYMLKKGINIMTNSPIVEVKQNEVVLKSGETIPTHTLIWTAGVQANSDAKDFGMQTARAGRIKVNEFMQAEDLEDVYVIGDLAYFEEEDGKPFPQIVEAAEQTAATAAKSIISEISGKEKKPFKGKYHGFMVSIGARYGVANLSGIRLSGWFAIFMKHCVNLFYLFGVRSGYYMLKYLFDEFFHSKDKRNVFRDTVNRYGNVLWSIPLRLFVGGFWIVEGATKLWGEKTWEKATSSWSNVSLLFQGLGDDSWLVDQSVKMPFEWLQSTTTSATTAASEAAGEWATPILSEMPGWFEKLMQFMIPTQGVAIFMQNVVVFIEIGMGLAIIFGLFTWFSNLLSVGFLTMFTLTAMLGWDKFWALPASIALMNGSGRTLGLDYWVVPYLQRKLGNIWYGKERALYDDHK